MFWEFFYDKLMTETKTLTKEQEQKADNIIQGVFKATARQTTEEGVVEVIVNSGQMDRDNEVLDIKGGNFENFLDKPVVIFAHQYDQPTIGKALSVWTDDQGQLRAMIKFATNEYEFANTVYKLMVGGYMPAISIGFRVLPDGEVMMADGTKMFTRWEMLEISVVPIGADPKAGKAKGIDAENIKKVKEVADGKMTIKDFDAKKEDETSVQDVNDILSILKKAMSTVEHFSSQIDKLEGREQLMAIEKAHDVAKLLLKANETLNRHFKEVKRRVVTRKTYVIK